MLCYKGAEDAAIATSSGAAHTCHTTTPRVQRTQHASQVVFHPSHFRCCGVMCAAPLDVMYVAKPAYSALLTHIIDGSFDFYSIDGNNLHTSTGD